MAFQFKPLDDLDDFVGIEGAGWKPPFGGGGAGNINPTFAGFLEEEPRAAFFGTLASKTGDAFQDTAARRRQAQDIYGQALGEFYGKLGEQIIGGEAPTAQFSEFLKGPDFNFTERFAQQGRQYNELSRYRPRTRHLYY